MRINKAESQVEQTNAKYLFKWYLYLIISFLNTTTTTNNFKKHVENEYTVQ